VDPNGEYTPSELIIKKRQGGKLSFAELEWFVHGFNNGTVTDYHMSAFLMAVCIRGMTNEEATSLTLAMVRTGRQVILDGVQPTKPKVDHQSTGGVGDKVSLILTPLIACFDVVVPQFSCRGLGHTGGLLDKIESIPGVSANVSTEQYIRLLDQVGCSVVAPSSDFVPVGEGIRSLRDVCGAVDNVALVASSIMSKKLAERPDSLFLDVKMGSGAFCSNLHDAASLASMMVSIGEQAGIDTVCMITNNDQPIGSMVGNWLEVKEAIDVMKGGSSSYKFASEVRETCIAQASVMLGLAGKADSFAQGCEKAESMLDSGAALLKFAEMVEAQGGNKDMILNPEEHNLGEVLKLVHLAHDDMVVQNVDAYNIGVGSMRLGAGRMYAQGPIDGQAGIELHAKTGSVVKRGDPIFTAFVGAGEIIGLDSPQVRLRNGFQKGVDAFKLIQNAPNNWVPVPPSNIEYFVDRNGLVPFKCLKK